MVWMEEDGVGEEGNERGYVGEHSLDARRKTYIEQVLHAVGYDYKKAAVLLEISVGRLRHLMVTLGISVAENAEEADPTDPPS